MGNKYIHLLECEDEEYMDTLLQNLQKTVGSGIHENIWVVHFTEEVPQQAYCTWLAKVQSLSQQSMEIEKHAQVDRVFTLYEGMIKIGGVVTQAIQKEDGKSAKTDAAIATGIKLHAAEVLPTPDQLMTATPESLTLKEWLEYHTPPDVILEKELCWPVEPELEY